MGGGYRLLPPVGLSGVQRRGGSLLFGIYVEHVVLPILGQDRSRAHKFVVRWNSVATDIFGVERA